MTGEGCLECGDVRHGFVEVACGACREVRLVPVVHDEGGRGGCARGGALIDPPLEIPWHPLGVSAERAASLVLLALLAHLTWSSGFNASSYAGSFPALLALAVLLVFGGLTSLLWLGRLTQAARLLLAALEVLMLVLLLRDGSDGDILGFALGKRFLTPVVGALRLGAVTAVLLVLLSGHLAAWGLIRAAAVVPLGLALAAGGTGLGLLRDWAAPTPAEQAARVEALYLARVPAALRAEVEALERLELSGCTPAASTPECAEARSSLLKGALDRHLGLGWHREVQGAIGWEELWRRFARSG